MINIKELNCMHSNLKPISLEDFQIANYSPIETVLDWE